MQGTGRVSLRAEPIERRDKILEMATGHGARKVRIFGSVARGKETGPSDLDLPVEFEPGRSPLNHIALAEDLEDLLGCKVDVVTERGLHWHIKDRACREAVPL